MGKLAKEVNPMSMLRDQIMLDILWMTTGADIAAIRPNKNVACEYLRPNESVRSSVYE